MYGVLQPRMRLLAATRLLRRRGARWELLPPGHLCLGALPHDGRFRPVFEDGSPAPALALTSLFAPAGRGATIRDSGRQTGFGWSSTAREFELAAKAHSFMAPSIVDLALVASRSGGTAAGGKGDVCCASGGSRWRTRPARSTSTLDVPSVRHTSLALASPFCDEGAEAGGGGGSGYGCGMDAVS